MQHIHLSSTTCSVDAEGDMRQAKNNMHAVKIGICFLKFKAPILTEAYVVLMPSDITVLNY